MIFSVIIIGITLLSVFAQNETSNKQEADIQKEQDRNDALLQSFTTIFISEIGDRTFMIGTIMAMRYNKMAVFTGSSLALTLMSGLSCLFGTIIPEFVPKLYTQLFATLLFFIFAFKLLYKWKYDEEDDEGDNEKKQVEIEIEKMENQNKWVLHLSENDVEDEEKQQVHNNEQEIQPKQGTEVPQIQTEEHKSDIVDISIKNKNNLKQQKPNRVSFCSVLAQTFLLTFFGEWGDSSQMTQISLAAVYNPILVFVGGTLGHISCETIGIIGGKYIANKISVKAVNLIGGVVFLFFAFLQGIELLMQT